MSHVAGWVKRTRATELGGLAGDSAYSAMWLCAVSVADLVQIALVSHILGLAQYGRLALVISVVVLVGQFFDVRVGTAETTFGAGHIAARNWDGASHVFRLGYCVDATTGVVGFLVVASIAPFIGPALIGRAGTELLLLYGLTLLVSTVDESSCTALRLMGRFRLLASYTVGLETIRIAAIAGALAVSQTLTAILVALVGYDIAGATVNWCVANSVFRGASGRSLVAKPQMQASFDRRSMLRTVLHTNVVSYARIAQVQLPTLLLGVVTSTSQVGLYKVGAAAGTIVARVVDPVYAAVLPRFSRLWARKHYAEITKLIRQATPIACGVVTTVLMLVLAFRGRVLELIGGHSATGAVSVLSFVAVGYAVSGALFWNTGLLFAAGRSKMVSQIAVSSAVIQIALLVPLMILFASVVSNLCTAFLGLRELRRRLHDEHQSDPITSDHRATAISSEYRARTWDNAPAPMRVTSAGSEISDRR